MSGIAQKKTRNTSGYVGVHYSKRLKQFYSTVYHEGTVINCGHSDDPRVAAKLRDKKIILLGLPLVKLQVLKPAS